MRNSLNDSEKLFFLVMLTLSIITIAWATGMLARIRTRISQAPKRTSSKTCETEAFKPVLQPQTAEQPKSKVDEIKELHSLFEQGIITEEEFSVGKKKILAG